MTRRLAPLIAVGAVVLIAVVAAVAGPVRVGESVIPFDIRDFEPSPVPSEETPEQDPVEDEEVPATPITVGIVFYTVLIGMAGIVLGGWALMWLVGWLVSRHRAARGPDDPDPNIAVAALRDAADLALYEAESAGPGRASDAVVACWLLLEQAAASAGTPRAAPQTPTEFTAAVLAEHRADRAAVANLLRLYHKARFGAVPLPDTAATTAASALRTISASLYSAAPASKDRT